MSTRSVQIQPKTPPPGRAGERQRPEAGGDQSSEGERIGWAEEPAGVLGVRGVRRARPARFSSRSKKIESLLGSEDSGEAAPVAPPSAEEELQNYIMPEVRDPTGLQPAHRMPVLHAVLSDVLPKLKDNENMHSLAEIVVRNEIARNSDLISRLNQGLPA